MRRVVALYRSSVGKKILVAFTGFLRFGFLVGVLAQYDQEGFAPARTTGRARRPAPRGSA